MLKEIELLEHQTRVLYAGTVSKRQLPRNFNVGDSYLFRHELEKVIPATKLVMLENVRVDSQGLVWRNGDVLSESFIAPEHFTSMKCSSRLRLLARTYLKKSRSIEEECICVIDASSYGYFHWLTDALTRLLAIRPLLGEIRVLLPTRYEGIEFVRSSLGAFGFPPMYVGDDEVLRCRKLWMPTHTAPTGNYNETYINGLRDLYAHFYGTHPSTTHFNNRVYISRSRSQRRKIANEDEVVRVLREYDFDVICFEDYSFDKQALIALRTRYLVSNHGAGLTNMLFMEPGGSVLELRKTGDFHNNCYFSLSSALNLNYYYQLCASEDPQEDIYINTANCTVNIELFRDNIQLMLQTLQT